MAQKKKPPKRKGAAKPAWERGYNGHVLWLGKTKLGKVTVHARYLEPGDQIDASELLGAMEELGLPPFSLKVVVAPEEQ